MSATPSVLGGEPLKTDSLVVFTHKFVNLRRKALLRLDGLLFLNTHNYKSNFTYSFVICFYSTWVTDPLPTELLVTTDGFPLYLTLPLPAILTSIS